LLVLHAAYVLEQQVTLSGGLGDNTTDILLSVILIVVTCVVFLFCIVHGVLYVRRLYWANKRAEMMVMFVDSLLLFPFPPTNQLTHLQLSSQLIGTYEISIKWII
jgi:hypothetical protein